MPNISFREVKVEYPGHVTGLNGISLEIEKGEFVFFVGSTGAGKSTLIKILTHEVRATGGHIVLGGRDITRLRPGEIPPLRRTMGIVPQDFALLPRKKVWENVAYAMRAVGHSRREVRKRVPQILEQVNIAHRADAFPHELSGGEQQRVAIARALINNPPLLLADEPTGNLDPHHSWEIMELLKAVNANGTTVLVASHDMIVIHRMGKRMVTLDKGMVSDDLPATNYIWSGLSTEITLEPAGAPTLDPIPTDDTAASSAIQHPATSYPVIEIKPEPQTAPDSVVPTESIGPTGLEEGGHDVRPD